MNQDQRKLIDQLTAICYEAGKKIMHIYAQPDGWDVEVKGDNSPLTKADKEANQVIEAGLWSLEVKHPIISEEGKEIAYDQRKTWKTFWLVDPLDGTKEFIKRNGQFTVNIALVENQLPVLGIIYAPATDVLYFGIKGLGAFKVEAKGEQTKIQVSNRTTNWVAVGSSSHASEEEQAFLAQYPISETIKSGSSLKFCKVAEGLADIYVRTGPTMEWDTAAGQCIAESAGATMTRLDGSAFLYNKESLLNGGFVCVKGLDI
jgi:3'(2'), 5'-bisphosphate nucleotidase